MMTMTHGQANVRAGTQPNKCYIFLRKLAEGGRAARPDFIFSGDQSDDDKCKVGTNFK